AGGAFSQIAGQPIGGLAALDATSGAVVWNPQVGGTPYVLTRSNGRFDLGGTFGAAGGFSANNLAGFLDAGAAAVGETRPALAFDLRAWPNPTHGVTRIDYALPAAAKVRLALYDVAGRRLATIAEGPRTAGAHSEPWEANAGGRDAGVYFLRLE